MGGGLMQLVAMGAQDVFLTGNPQITFFKVVYRRHTNFSKECIEQEFNGNIPSNNSGSVTATLARNGDLVQEIYMKALLVDSPYSIIIPNDISKFSLNSRLVIDNNFSVGDIVRFNKTITQNLAQGTNDIFVQDTNYIIGPNSTLSSIELLDGTDGTTQITFNNTVPTPLVGEENDINIQENTLLLRMVGERDMTNLVQTVEVEIGGQKIDKHYSAWLDIYNELFEKNHDYRNIMSNKTSGNDKTVYIPLRFWFNRNAGLALPLIALQYHEVKILIDLKVPSDVTLNNAHLLVNYIYLDTDERRRFAQVSHEYLIEQIQHTGIENIQNGNNKVDMNFNHPVKALLWTTEGKSYLNNISIQLNGHDRFSEQPADYFHLVQPYECHVGNGNSLHITNRTWGPVVSVNANNPVGMYSFALKPEEHQPSGTCNFSRIDNARLVFKGGSASDDTLHLFALNYNVLRIMSGMGGLTYSN